MPIPFARTAAAALTTVFLGTHAHAQYANSFLASVVFPHSFCSSEGHPVDALINFEPQTPITAKDVAAISNAVAALQQKLGGYIEEVVETKMPQPEQKRRMDALLAELEKKIAEQTGRNLKILYDAGAVSKLDEKCTPKPKPPVPAS